MTDIYPQQRPKLLEILLYQKQPLSTPYIQLTTSVSELNRYIYDSNALLLYWQCIGSAFYATNAGTD